MRQITRWIAVACVMCCTAAIANAQDGFLAWVGLYEAADLGWLENENRLGDFCTDSSTLAECYARYLSPRITVHELYREPSESSDQVGELVVAATPGRGLSAHFRAAGATGSVVFVPDLFLQDWGYGPYFHQTLSEQSGGWIRLPAGPWETDVWLSRGSEGSLPVMEVRSGDIIEMDDAGWFVVATERDALLLRPEQPGDHWCEEGAPPSADVIEATRFTRAQMVDRDGHLLFRLKYLKGC